MVMVRVPSAFSAHLALIDISPLVNSDFMLTFELVPGLI